MPGRKESLLKKQQPPSIMILIMFILLLLALSPLIFQQVYTAFVHQQPLNLSAPTRSPRNPDHNQVRSCSPTFMTAHNTKTLSLHVSAHGQDAQCIIVVASEKSAPTLYISPLSL